MVILLTCIIRRVQSIIEATGVQVKPRHVQRVTGKDELGEKRPGIVKVELPSKEIKIEILKNKSVLRSGQFKKWLWNNRESRLSIA